MNFIFDPARFRLRPSVIVLAMMAAACGDDSTCPDGYNCCPEGFVCTPVTGGTGGVGGDGSGGNAGGTGGIGGDGGSGAGGSAPSCTPTEGESIGAECGVFVGVEPGDGAPGTKLNPYLSLQEAIENLPSNGNRNIYVCESFAQTGAFTIPDNVKIYGRLECESYVYGASRARPQLTGNANVPVVTIDGDVTLSGLSFEAAPATTSGSSSIGILLLSGELRLNDSDVLAKDGAPGSDGDMPGTAAPTGNNGTKPVGTGCSGTQNNGGSGGAAPVCIVGGAAGAGGGGGAGLDGTTGAAGFAGGPMMTGGAAGQAQMGATNCSTGGGGISLAGANGNPAGEQSDLGTLGPDAPYYLLPTVVDGFNGVSGRGGGGGGGAQACNNDLAGPGGGGGGSGGCGGAGGNSGSSGGASFGVVILDAGSLIATDSSITAGSGGDGGDGRIGQTGGGPGTGGAPQDGTDGIGTACNGGAGGKGGNGGPGAAGAGGPAAAIVRSGTQAVSIPNTDLDHGAGGLPGSPAAGGTNGLMGFSCTGNQALNVDARACDGV